MEDTSPTCTSRRAFLAAPDPDRYYPARTAEDARRRISRSIERGEGPALLIGGTGMGKSMLLEVLARQFYSKMSTVLLAGAQLCTRRALQQSILFQLGLPYQGVEEGELRLSLLTYLRPRDGEPRRLLLLVDEADSLPTRLLEELRVLTNIADSGQVLVNLVLSGKPILEERFAEPELGALNQRISQRCYLAAFGREETLQYLRAQVAAAGMPSGYLAQDGLEAIFAATDGVPRLVNQLGDQLVWLSDETGYAPIDGAIVQQAWSEIQQLPAPWNLQNSKSVGTEVEYGELTLKEDEEIEEEIDETPSLIPIKGHSSKDVEESYFDPMISADYLEDQLVEHFAGLEVADRLPSSEIEAVVAKNPFQESFHSEEVVIDQYLGFESNVLTAAPRVINRTDTSFAQQLKQCEKPVSEKKIVEDQDMHITLDDELELAVLEEEEESDLEIDSQESLCMASSQVEASQCVSPGELLVIVDEVAEGPTVVSGNRFRQLFSSLETATTPQRFH